MVNVNTQRHAGKRLESTEAKLARSAEARVELPTGHPYPCSSLSTDKLTGFPGHPLSERVSTTATEFMQKS